MFLYEDILVYLRKIKSSENARQSQSETAAIRDLIESQSLESKGKVMSVWVTFQTHWSMHVTVYLVSSGWNMEYLKISIKILILIHTSFKIMFKIHLMLDAFLTDLAGRIIFPSSNVAVKKCIFFSNLHNIFTKKIKVVSE